MQLEHDHSREAIEARLSAGRDASYLADFIYGGIDGCVTTFAIVAGVAGAGLPTRIVLIMGFANMLADGLSMAAANYSGVKAERDNAERLLAIERRHIALAPEGEREEIRQIFAAKGFSGGDLERIVEMITSDETRWAHTMLVEEYGLPPAHRSPHKAGLSTFVAFLACGIVPLLPYLLGSSRPFEFSIACTGLTFFGIGSMKSRWSMAVWWRSGLETFAIGLAAAGVAYGAGALIEMLV